MGKKLSRWAISVGVRLCGYHSGVSLYPFGTWRRLLFVIAKPNSMMTGWRLVLGPMHVHGFYLGPKLIAVEFDVRRDPFWGGPLSVPAGYRTILGPAA